MSIYLMVVVTRKAGYIDYYGPFNTREEMYNFIKELDKDHTIQSWSKEVLVSPSVYLEKP